MRLNDEGTEVTLEGEESRKLERHLAQFERLTRELVERERAGKLRGGWKEPLRGLKDVDRSREFARAKTKLRNDGDTSLKKEEMDATLRYLEHQEQIVKEFEAGEESDDLDDDERSSWGRLKRFLESEELEGSARDLPDGTYCCQWRSRGLVSGQRECAEYVAWYIFAWFACVGAAIFKNADATLVGGSCADMPGCP
jgi:hypothetical protein